MAYVGMDYFTQGPYQGLPDVFTTYQKYLNDAGTTNPGITGINTNLMYPYGQGGGDGGNPGTAGTCNTGGGGGGASGASGEANTGGNGGSGIVIIRYKFQ